MPHKQQEAQAEASATHAVPASGMILGVCGTEICKRDGQWYIHHSFGRILEKLAPHFKELRYYSGEVKRLSPGYDYMISASNISIHPWGAWRNTLNALKRPDRLLANYRRMARECDGLLLRGSAPLIWVAHLLARLRGIPVVHWIVGNPLAIMRGEKRGYGRVVESLGIIFASFEQRMLKVAIRISRGHTLANGQELGKVFASPRTQTIVSTSITKDDFHHRKDTCLGDRIRLLFVGYIRPEKGIEFLIRALPLIHSAKPVHLALAGSWEQFGTEHQRLQSLIRKLGLEDRVSWEGYAAYGSDLFRQMDDSDILVLPTLSEGTPRVLVEARARSLPIVSTTVGGIPSSVTDGYDGLLVPPKSPEALAAAISTIMEDAKLRRRLVDNGRATVSALTIDRFVDSIVSLLSKAANV